MTRKTYSTLDVNRVGESLLLDAGQTVVTTTAVCDLHRMVLGTTPAFSGRFVYECYFWSQSRGDLSGLIAFGVVPVGSDLGQFVGEQDGFGFKPADGEIWNNNASIASVGTVEERVALGVVLELSPTSCTCDFMVNGTSVYQATLPTGYGWLPAISIGSDEPGDISATVSFGKNRFDTMTEDGWLEYAPGLPDITLSLCTDAMLLRDGTAGPVRYKPRLVNGRAVSIRREPKAWFQQSGRANPAGITSLRLDNSTGDFNALLESDLRDADVTLKIVRESSRGVAETSIPVFVGVLENVSAPNVSTVEVTLRDVLSRLDRPMRVRVVPPFRDQTSAGRMLPIGLGAQRNVQPLLIDAEDEGGLYALGDAPMSNVTLASDQAAPLDPHSTPPQYRPVDCGANIILDSPPVGRFAVDCSSVGQQYQIPGVDDVLNGDGDFTHWTSAGVPDGWEISTTPNVVANGSIVQVGSNGVRLTSAVPYNPITTNPFYYGFWMRKVGVLEPGATYRITINLTHTIATTTDPLFPAGLVIFTKLKDNPRYWVTPYKSPLAVPFGVSQVYTFTFEIPRNETSNLDVYIAAIPYFSGFPPSPISVAVEFKNVRVKKLGEYTIAPLDGITVKDAFTEILVNREGEDPSIFSASDCEAIDDATGYKLGFRYTDVPNVLDVLQDIADQVGAAIFTDANGTIRIRRLSDPTEGTPVAAFTTANVVSASVRIWEDTGQYFTTLIGAPPNCVPFGAGDFVTDTVTVPADIRARYQGTAQFLMAATTEVAQQYQATKAASRKIYKIDDQDNALAEINRIAADLFSGKALYVSFDALFDELVGVEGVACEAHEIYYGDVVTFMGRPISVTATELFAAQGRITITGRYVA